MLVGAAWRKSKGWSGASSCAEEPDTGSGSQCHFQTTGEKTQWVQWVQERLQHLVSTSFLFFKFKKHVQGFPGGAVVKNPPANARDTGSSPGPGRSHMPRSN